MKRNCSTFAWHRPSGKGWRNPFSTVLADMAEQGAATIFLEVRESNAPARQLYQSVGLLQVRVRKNYYPTLEGREDAILMSRQL